MAVDGNDVVHFVFGGFVKGDGDTVALADVVDQNRNIETVDKAFELLVVRVLVLSKVHCQDLGLNSWVFGFDFVGERDQFRFGAGNEEDVEAGAGDLNGEFFSETV